MSLRVALIGTGWVADKHLRAIHSLPDVRVVAIGGRNAAATAELAARAEARAYGFDDIDQMLKSERLDAVFVLLPPHLHGELEARLADYVPAVLIEKPVANDLDVARRVHERFQKAGTLVSVGFMCRYRKSVARAREVLAGSTGQPILINGSWVGEMPPPPWWRNRAQSGGQFVEQCTHLVDLARYFNGAVDEVSACSARGFVSEHPGYSVDDAAVVNVRFACGAVGNFTTGCFVQPGYASALGVALTLQLRTLQIELRSWNMDLRILRREGEVEALPSPEPDIFAVQNAAFFEAIRKKDPDLIRSSYADALETLKVGLAAERSLEMRRPVSPQEL
jgi:predicted dehydrogenase